MKSVKIKSINKIQHTSKRYDITVAENHNFFANNILVHNCQNLTSKDIERICNGKDFTITEKLDGSSMSVYIKGDEFGICSRNMNFDLTSCDNTYTKVASKYDLEHKFRNVIPELLGNCAIQGELIGPGIQGNKYNLLEHEFRVFNIFLIEMRTYLSQQQVESICHILGLPTVPNLGNIKFENVQDFNIKKIKEMSDGMSKLNPNQLREGIVFKNNNNSISFKSISNEFLLKDKS